MLIEFNFSNFKSYRERASLQMTAGRGKKHSFHLTEYGGEKFLPCAAIFGANASGKSNVYEAFVFMKNYVVNSFGYGGGDAQQSSFRQPRSPFLFNDFSATEPTEFEVFFIDDADPKQRVWQYGFAIDDSKVVAEWLSYKWKTSSGYRPVFLRRSDGKIEWSDDRQDEGATASLERALEPEALVVSLGNKLRIAEFQRVARWFASNRALSFSAPAENLFRASLLPVGFDADVAVQESLVQFLSTFDSSIKGFNVEKTVAPDNPNAFLLKIDSKHKIARQETFRLLPFANESGGTQKMFSLYADVKGALDHGGVLFIDELGARLHPLLHLNILLSFINPEINRKHAQLIVTTHDVSLLEVDCLRDDEMWIAEKNEEEESSLFSLAEFKDIKKLRGKNNRSLMKNYLVGKLGGVPALSPIRFGER